MSKELLATCLTMIELRNVTFSYNGRPVIKGVTFAVVNGVAKAILGPSGSGKTTLLRIILGLLKPETGRVSIDGQDITRMRERDLLRVRRKMGVVFQEGALFDSLTVGENVAYGLREHTDLSEDEIQARVLQLLHQVELGDIRAMMPDELSGGMKRRVAVARALAYRPHMLLYDEPTTGLDPIVCQTICDLITKLQASEGVTSVIITHDIATAFRLAQEFILMREGEILFEGSHEELLISRDAFVRKFLSSRPVSVYGSTEIDVVGT